MTQQNSKKPLSYLDNEKSVSALWHKLKKMEQLHAVVSPYLDKNIREYCKATSFINGKLTIIAANSSIATQLHFQSTDLVRKLKHEEIFKGLQTIHCKIQVQTPRTSRASSKKKIKPLSAKSADIISEIADGIEDPKLREIMRRLARNC